MVLFNCFSWKRKYRLHFLDGHDRCRLSQYFTNGILQALECEHVHAETLAITFFGVLGESWKSLENCLIKISSPLVIPSDAEGFGGAEQRVEHNLVDVSYGKRASRYPGSYHPQFLTNLS